jgi:ABC-2 type transport system ATP-binding protein
MAGCRVCGRSLQRAGLAQAPINTPELVFLDEPTSGLHPLGTILVREIIQELRDRGTTVFLNSHLLGEVEATCDRVAFVRQGRIVRELSLAQAVVFRSVGFVTVALLLALRQFRARAL